ncbi:DNA-binding protein [Diplocarpon rosae]|nr:DNA-binding protein [Diplocarpon rosae]
MLLPSAIGCDSSIQTPTTRYQSALFTSPPLSPPASSSSSSRPAMNLYSTCRALQSMLTTPNQLPSPPTAYAEPPSSPMKLRLRTRKGHEDTTTPTLTPKKITKRNTVAPRALNKRRRAASDDTGRSDIDNETRSWERGEEVEEPDERRRGGIEEELASEGEDSWDVEMIAFLFFYSTLARCSSCTCNYIHLGRILYCGVGTRLGLELMCDIQLTQKALISRY